MHVWLIKIGEPLPLDPSVRKLRTGMLADKLAERGHEVVWWTSSFDHHQKKMVFRDNEKFQLHPQIKIRTLKGIGYRDNVSFRRYLDHWIISKKFKKTAADDSMPDIIVASMPDYHLTYEAVSFANRNRIPILVDIRDQWPDIFLELVPYWIRPIVKTMLLRDYQKVSSALKYTDGIIAVTRNWLEWGLKKAFRHSSLNDSVFYLGAPKLDEGLSLYESDKISAIKQLTKGHFLVTFIGTFSYIYNPLVIIKAAKLLNDLADPMHQPFFVLAGDGPFHHIIKKQAKGFKNVIMPGWLNDKEMGAILSLSSIGVVPCNVPIQVFPNKAFTYLSAGLPIISSVDGDLNDLLMKYEAGFQFPINNAQELVRCINILQKDSVLLERMRINAHRLFEEKLESNRIYTAFVNHIEKVAIRGKQSHETFLV